MQTLKSGMVDEDGMGINAVDKALKQVGLTLRDGERGFKDLDDVLEEVGKGWHTYDEFQKSQLVTAIAGVRQANILVALLDNQEMAQKLVTEQIGKDTLAQERYAEVLKGVEASQNRMRASWEKLVMNFVTSEFIAGLFNAGAGILDFIDKIGGIATVLKIVIPLVVLFNAAWIQTNLTLGYTTIISLTKGLFGMIPALLGATGATGGLTVALGAANVAALPFVGTLALLTAGTMLYASELKKAREEQEKIRTDLQNKTGNVSDNASSYSDYVSKAKEAAKAEGYVYDETGKMFKKGYHDMLVYVNGMDLLTESQWEANQSALMLKNSEEETTKSLEKVSQTAEEAAKSIEVLREQAFSELLSNKSFNDVIEDTITLLKDAAKSKKDSLQLELKNLKSLNDKYKEHYKYQLETIKNASDEKKKNLEAEIKAQNDLYDSQKKAIEEQLNAYESLIDEQKTLLNLKKKEEDFNNKRAEKEKNLAELTSQIEILRLDTSEEAMAQRLLLEEQESKLKQEIAQIDSDRAYEIQLDALTEEENIAKKTAEIQLSELERVKKNYEIESELKNQALEEEKYLAEKRYEIIIEGLDNSYAAKEIALNNEISQIDTYLSQEGLLRKEAIDRIISDNGTLYKDLSEWNRVYGTGIEKDIRDKWNLAKSALEDYKNTLSGISSPNVSVPTLTPSSYDISSGDDWMYPTHHSGVDAGFVGGKAKLKSNEEFIKAMDGELLINPKQMDKYMNSILPSTMNQPQVSSRMNGMTVGNLMNIVVNGTLDKNVLPDIKNIANRVLDEINNSILIRGNNRRADMFGQ